MEAQTYVVLNRALGSEPPPAILRYVEVMRRCNGLMDGVVVGGSKLQGGARLRQAFARYGNNRDLIGLRFQVQEPRL